MNKIIILTLFMLTGLVSCKTSEKNFDKLEIAKKYYKALDDSDDSEIANILSDTILIRENEYDYEEVFPLKRYAEWIKWDSVFNPTYEVLTLEEENGTVRAKISKMDKRISFLHKGPIVTNETIFFDDDKINRVEKTKYLIFNEVIFVKNRDELVDWIKKNHPELDGFINDQTKQGGLNYLKAIERYEKAH
ncbi:hypothetical protein J8L85_15620 [Maribacter sp. MMG018]|uniref:hypothetical protein n=1 Tax=Maribacter sp. MMG018 TaxID=2822688 RepID=UPI001B38C288|nr:hypothetical protein [Maribacter sp. MMG018]MBQ4915884.1 hypothetical protein [Maribacter sp. MMG018]